MQQIDEEQRRAVRRYAKVLRDLPHLDRSSRHGRVHGFVSRGQQITPEADDKSMRPTSPWEQGLLTQGKVSQRGEIWVLHLAAVAPLLTTWRFFFNAPR